MELRSDLQSNGIKSRDLGTMQSQKRPARENFNVQIIHILLAWLGLYLHACLGISKNYFARFSLLISK